VIETVVPCSVPLHISIFKFWTRSRVRLLQKLEKEIVVLVVAVVAVKRKLS